MTRRLLAQVTHLRFATVLDVQRARNDERVARAGDICVSPQFWSQQPFSAAFPSSLSQQLFPAAFLSSLSQQPFSEAFPSKNCGETQLLSSRNCSAHCTVDVSIFIGFSSLDTTPNHSYIGSLSKLPLNRASEF